MTAKNRNGAKKEEEEDDEGRAGKGNGEEKAARADAGGKSLGTIALIDANITKAKIETLQTLHTILYEAPGKPTVLKKNLRKFDGFEFGADSEQYKKRLQATIDKQDAKKLALTAEILALDKKGSKEELAGRICSFLLKPDGDEELPEDDEEGEEEEEDDAGEEEEEEEEESEEEAPKKKAPARRGPPAKAPARGGRGDTASSKSSSGRPKRSTAGRGYQGAYT